MTKLHLTRLPTPLWHNNALDGLLGMEVCIKRAPVYTGKALFGLGRLSPKPRRALFLHTGGLPGLLADPDVMRLSCS
jgi:hypothetical protein